MSPRQSYTLFMFLAAAVFLTTRHFMPRPAALAVLPWWKRAALAWAVLVGAALGAKLGFVVSRSDGWLSGTTWLGDGKTVTTGLVGAYLAVEAAKLLLGIRVKTGDTYALPLALALAVGRWGCWFNGCCHGTATDLPWGVDFGDGVRRHPTQLYEALFHLAMAGVLLVVMLRGVFLTHRLQLYLIAYGVYRFVSEFIRPEPPWLAGLTFYQWAALVLVIGLCLQWWYEVQVEGGEPRIERAEAPTAHSSC